MRFSRTFYWLLFFIFLGTGCFLYFRPSYPISKTLENHEGRVIEAVIQGREGDKIIIDRISDNARFEVPVDTLSFKDRVFTLLLRESPPPVEYTEDSYVATRREAISALRKKEQVIKTEIDSRTLNDLLHQNRIEQLQKVQEEIRELQVAIDTYKYRTGN